MQSAFVDYITIILQFTTSIGQFAENLAKAMRILSKLHLDTN